MDNRRLLFFQQVGVYYFFNRKKFHPKKEKSSPSELSIIAAPQEPKVRLVYEQTSPVNLEKKSLADLTVKYDDYASGNYELPKLLPVNELPKKANEADLSDYINIFSIKKQKDSVPL